VCHFTELELFEIISQRDLPERPLPGMLAPPRDSRQRQPGLPNIHTKKKAAAAPLAKLAALFSGSMKEGLAGGSVTGDQGVVVTMREVMKILRRHLVLRLSLPDAVMSLLAARVEVGSAAAEQLQQQLRSLGGEFATLVLPQLSDYSLTKLPQGASGVRFAAGTSCYVDFHSADLQRIQQQQPGQQLPAALQAALVQVAFAVAAGEPVMLLGPTSFKSTVVDMWCQLMGQEKDLVKVHLSPGKCQTAVIFQQMCSY
jgi:hypothetical protein